MLIIFLIALLFLVPELRKTLWLLISNIAKLICGVLAVIVELAPTVFKYIGLVLSFIISLFAWMLEMVNTFFGRINSKFDK